MKILWLTNIPSPYRVAFFNELGKLCDLTVLFEREASSSRDDSWKNFNTDHFTPVFLKGTPRGTDTAFCPSVTKYLKKNRYDKIIVTNYSDYTGMLAVATLRLRGIPYIVEGDGAFAGSGKGAKEKLKRFLLRKSALCFSTAKPHDDYYRTYGVTDDRIVRYPFTSLKEADILTAPTSAEEKASLRQELGMTEEKILISVGQFIRRKGYDVLFDALAKLPKNIGCYIIGGTPTEEYLQQADRLGLENVHFVGFKLKDELARYYMAADAFVLPTREDIWGLVVNEAMAKGLPVITTNRCVAGLELITRPELGQLVPANDAEALATAIASTLAAKADSSAILSAIAPYTIENMAKRHMEILKGN